VIRRSGLQRGLFVVGGKLPTEEVFIQMVAALALHGRLDGVARLQVASLPVVHAAVSTARSQRYRSLCDESPITKVATWRTAVVLTQVRARVESPGLFVTLEDGGC
jgi:hypothetical protein